MKIEMKHSTDFIQIVYEIPNGIQRQATCNPGHPYQGTHSRRLPPQRDQGHHLLVRLKSAWNSGLIFTIGTSLSTGECNAVTWSTILHKTSLHSRLVTQILVIFQSVTPSLDALQVPGSKRHTVQNECISYYAPPSMVTSLTIGALRPPPTANVDGDCVICFDFKRIISTMAHRNDSRLQAYLPRILHSTLFALNPQCPSLKPVGEPQGRSPLGPCRLLYLQRD
jgi:hypothetical protein